jgi:hypothetical protein
MRVSLKAAGLASILAAAAAAGIPELKALDLDTSVQEGQAITTDLGSTSAITYWIGRPDGWHVITTVSTTTGEEGNSANVLRVSSVLLPGQSQVISSPGNVGENPQVLQIRRTGDRIDVAQIADAD